MKTEHEAWLKDQLKRRAAEHQHVLDSMHKKIEAAAEARAKSAEALKEAEDEADKKWTQDTDDDEYFE